MPARTPKVHYLLEAKVTAAGFSSGCGLHLDKTAGVTYRVDAITGAVVGKISATTSARKVTCKVCRARINKGGATYKTRGVVVPDYIKDRIVYEYCAFRTTQVLLGEKYKISAYSVAKILTEARQSKFKA